MGYWLCIDKIYFGLYKHYSLFLVFCKYKKIGGEINGN